MASGDTRNTAELDWFDFETRMRDVIHELIEPVIKRASEDREVSLGLQRKTELATKRLDQLENIVLKTGKKNTVFDEINQRFVGIEGDRKKY
jgi:hypothetical protein